MPYASKAQQRYFHANRAELERQGVDVDEWDRETNFKTLPEKKNAMSVKIRPHPPGRRPETLTTSDTVDAGPGHAPAMAQRGAAPGQMSGVKGAAWFAPIKESAARSIPRDVQDVARLAYQDIANAVVWDGVERAGESQLGAESRRGDVFRTIGGIGLGLGGAIGGGLLGSELLGESQIVIPGLLGGAAGGALGSMGGSYLAGVGSDGRMESAIDASIARVPRSLQVLEGHPIATRMGPPNKPHAHHVMLSGLTSDPTVRPSTPAEYKAAPSWNYDDLIRYIGEGGPDPTITPFEEEVSQKGVYRRNKVASASHWFAPIKVGDKLPGGLADWRPDSDFDSVELAKGQAVEMEHADDPSIAREIAKDHLVEDPRYYVALKVMEDHLEDTEKKGSDRSRFVAHYLRKGLEKGSLAPR